MNMKNIIQTLLITITLLLMSSSAVNTENLENLLGSYEIADIKLGGQLYDNWHKVKKVNVRGRHPLYPDNGRIKDGNTWRCKECHGWDYKGGDGRYGEGMHYTGIRGVFDAREKTPLEIYDAIANAEKDHDFSKHIMLSFNEIWTLVKFIREGLVDIETVVGPAGIVNGDTENGKKLYGKHCMECHGPDGNKIYSRENLEGTHGIGWEANSDPQETLHKIRWGHPGTDMPSAVVDLRLSEEDIIDVLSYCQTLYP